MARIWVANVGRVPLLLLDSDMEENPGHYRDVTDRLYGGTSEHRLRQELLLGVGGVRALRVFSRLTGAPEPEVFHTNEGHAGFLGLERIRELTVDKAGPKLDFDTALEVSRAGTVFTTHTPVPAGIDRFPRELIEQYFSGASAVPGCADRSDRGARRRGLRRRRRRGLQHGGHGLPSGAARQRRLLAARRGQPRDVQRALVGVRRVRGADRFGHQRRARSDLDRARGLRGRGRTRWRPGFRRHRFAVAVGRSDSRQADVGSQADPARAPGRRCAQADGEVLGTPGPGSCRTRAGSTPRWIRTS